MEIKINYKVTYTHLILLVLGSISYLISKDYTAFNWPTSDMFNFFIKMNDSSLLINDDYTNQLIKEPNPRWIYGKIIIFLSKLFNNDWFYVIWILKVSIAILQPVLLYLLLDSILYKFDKNHNTLKRTLLFLSLFILVTFQNVVPRLSAIAWWIPFYTQPNPQNISWIFGICFLLFSSYKKKIFSSIFLFVSTLIHPTVGFISFSFLLLIRNDKLISMENLKFLILMTIPIFILVTGFKSENILSDSRFVEIYSFENHPRHYNFHQFGTFFNLNIIFLISVICGFYLTPTIFFLEKTSLFLGLDCLDFYFLFPLF